VRGLDGKVALVTGGRGGMGEAAARRLRRGGRHGSSRRRARRRGQAARRRARRHGRFVKLDVTSEDDWQEAVAYAEREFGRIDILVNNAGILDFGLIDDMPTRGLRPPRRGQPVRRVPRHEAHRPGARTSRRRGDRQRVVVEGLGGGAYLTAYTASKFAVRGMTKAAAWELGPRTSG
jgi:3alpha(or 20beta)-hydroxysteroid dehydrogenase